MKFEIKNRSTRKVQFIAEIDCDENKLESIKKGLAVKWALENKANLIGANLYGANLEGANLTRANLYGANLTGANLIRANLTGANLTDATLIRANLTGADLTEATLTRANLYGANLEGANLYGANLYGANLEGANLTRADLTEANLYGANLDFSSLPLWCGSLKANFDDKQIIQFLYHTISGCLNSNHTSKKLKKALSNNKLLEIANKFHRTECKRLEE